MSDFLGFVSLLLLVGGVAAIIRPTLVKPLLKRELSRKQVILIFIGLLFLIGIIDSAVAPSKPDTKTEQTSAVIPTQKTKPITLTPTQTLTLEDRIKKSLNDPRSSITVTPSANNITVTVDTQDPVSKYGTGVLYYVGDANLDATAVFTSAFPLDQKISSVTTNLYVEVTDIYGKKTFKKLVSITLSRDKYNKIAWDNFDNRNYPQVADNYYIDKSIKDTDIYPSDNQ